MSKHNEYCHNCGVAISEPSAFCPSCGTALSEPEAGVDSGGSAARSFSAGTQSSSVLREPGPSAARTTSRAVSPISDHSSSREARSPELGTPAGPPRPPAAPEQRDDSRKWLPLVATGSGVVVVAALVVILLIALGGSAGKNLKSTSVTRAQALQLLAANGTTTVSRVSPGLFAVVTTGKLGALVPAGWRATAQSASGTSRAEFADPKHPDSTLTIVTQKATGASDHRRALSARAAVKARGYSETVFGPISFPGGRQAWRLSYVKAGATHETYFYSGCDGAAAMVVDVSAASGEFAREQPALAASVASAEPLC